MPVTRDAVAMEREPYPSCLVYGSMKKLLSGLETEKLSDSIIHDAVDKFNPF